MHELTFLCVLSRNMKKQVLKYNTSLVIFNDKHSSINLFSTYYTGIFSTRTQVAICPGESQFLLLQSACQKIKAYRTSNSEGNIQRFGKQTIPPFNQLSLSPQAEIVVITMGLTRFDSSCICACWSSSFLVKAWALNLCLF